MQEEGVVQLAPRLEVARGIGRQDSWQGMRRDNKVAESNHCREGLPLPSKQTKIHPAGLLSPFVPVVYCYFVSVKLLCYSTQGGNDLTLWGWSYFGQDSFVSKLSYFLQLLSVTSSLYPSLSPKLQQEDWFKAFFRAPSIRFRLRNCSLAFVPRKHWICGAAAKASHWAETEAGSL